MIIKFIWLDIFYINQNIIYKHCVYFPDLIAWSFFGVIKKKDDNKMFEKHQTLHSQMVAHIYVSYGVFGENDPVVMEEHIHQWHTRNVICLFSLIRIC